MTTPFATADIVSANGNELTTTSEAIAAGTGFEHASVIRLVREKLTELQEFGLVGFEIRARPAGQHGGADVEYAVLNEDQATTLIMFMRNIGVVTRFKVALVKAFRAAREKIKALEQRDPMTVLNDPSAMRGLLLSYTEKVIALEAKTAELTPKAAALDLIATRAEGSCCITDAAKALQIAPKALFQWLQTNGWIYRRAGGKSWLGYQTKTQQGCLEHKICTISTADGDKIHEQVLVTAKGLSVLSGIFAEGAAQ